MGCMFVQRSNGVRVVLHRFSFLGDDFSGLAMGRLGLHDYVFTSLL